MAASVKPRVLAAALLLSVSCLLVGSFGFPISAPNISWAYIPQFIQRYPTFSKSLFSEIYHCQDPYRRPGYLYIDEKEHRNTRWIPYTSQFLEADDPSTAEYPAKNHDILFNQTGVESSFLNATSTPPNWLDTALSEARRRGKALPWGGDAEDFASMKSGGDMGWLWGRRVLIAGDSVDRFMVQYFCEEFGSVMRQPRMHTTATCSIEALNLTLVHWHHAGSFTFRPDWWWMKDMAEIPLEERWEALWKPTFNFTRGPHGRPDLFLWQSGLWDERTLWENGEAHYKPDETMGQRQRQLIWQEIRFVSARTKKFLSMVRDEFGSDMPSIFRAYTLHRESDARDANLYELERLSRALAERAGHEIFEWGRLLSGFSMLYKDQTHLNKGPASWLWGNMLLEYLARSAGQRDASRAPYFDSWNACHSELCSWGGR